MTLQSDICIVGNGVIGKVAALGCAQAGYSVTLLAPSGTSPDVAVDSWDVRVYALNGVARDLLSSLRVWNALDATRIAPVDAMLIHGDGDQQAGKLRFDAYGARVDALAWIVEDRNLNQALDAALQFAPNVRRVSGRATALRQGLERASITLDNSEVLEAALVVGADGSHSWVRGQCEIGLDYRPYHQQAVVTNFECEQPHHGVATQWFTSTEGVIALLPLAGKRVSLVWSAPDSLAEMLMREPLAMLAQRLTNLPAQRLGALTPLLPESVKALPLALMRPHAMIAPRVALVGDAAHVVHPLAGHGMNLGFADVAVLLRVMADRGRGRDCGDARLLANYARRRKEEVLAMLIATDGLERLFAAQAEPLRLARNLGLNLVNHLPVIKRKLIGHALGRPI
jgi:2-octaprenylphenol hydroxylase